MQEFYKTFISPSSTSRARISIHLHARGAGALDTKIIELLLQAGLEDVPAEQRQCLDLLQKYLKEKTQLTEDKVSSLVDLAKECGLKPAVPDAESANMVHGSSAVNQATEITDIRRFKAGLLASAGARPVKDLSEYEDIDSKL